MNGALRSIQSWKLKKACPDFLVGLRFGRCELLISSSGCALSISQNADHVFSITKIL
jgi:hypothetical protein